MPLGLESLMDRLPSSLVSVGIAAVVLIVVLTLLFTVLIPSCSHKDEASQPAANAQSASTRSADPDGIVAKVIAAKNAAQTAVETANQMGSLERSNTKVQALITLLGEEEAAKLISQAKTNPEALWIAAHPDAYAFDGIETQYKILKLAADEPSAVPFVRAFPSKYPSLEPIDDKSLAVDSTLSAGSVPDTAFPRLYQWDPRWGNTIYGQTAFGLAGGGPTALAMVYRGLVATDLTPYDIGKKAQDRGMVIEGGETMNTLFTEAAADLGLECNEIGSDADAARQQLAKGNPVIANVGPGTFTADDHFVVLAGLTNDGRAIVNDPYSTTRSAQTWDIDLLATESYTMFAFTAK